MRVLVVGGGGREAAIAWKLAQNPDVQVFCAPGNAGIATDATCRSIELTDIEGLLAFAQEKQIDLTVVGPEAPLILGIVDRFREEGLAICGPTSGAARAEGSKAWFKRLLWKFGIPTAYFEVFDDPASALAYVKKRGPGNVVVKADGLMSGKGVFLPETVEQAETVLTALMRPGTPGETVVIEDRLYGVERSSMSVCDGLQLIMLPFTQDYKREGDGDTGRNTGGMGAHTVDLSDDGRSRLCTLQCQVFDALRSGEGLPYTGFMYLGVMMTDDGPKVLECNVRLGDPETQAILPVLSGDFAELCMAAATGSINRVSVPWRQQHANCVVLTSAEYPDSSKRDDLIEGIDAALEIGALVFHAGTGWRDGQFTTNKAGRVLGVVGTGGDLRSAQALSYAAAGRIDFPGMRLRRDIGPHGAYNL